MLTALDLFSGIGGFALGFHRAGIQTSAFCEVEPYAQRVLAKNFPGIPIHDDVRTLNAARLAELGVGRPDIICGGFPCQDISTAGRGAGLDGERSGLWGEYARIIGELRPRWVVAENSPALRARGADRVCADLEEHGYTTVPVVVGAVHAGAPHRRQRAWVVAYAHGLRKLQPSGAFPELGRRLGDGREEGRAGEDVAHPARQQHKDGLPEKRWTSASVLSQRIQPQSWPPEPDVGRVAYGVPSRVDRLRCLGNAVVPDLPEIIGRAILKLDHLVP